MAKINPRGMQMAGMDSMKYYSKQPMKSMPMKKKMSPAQVAKRKRTTLSNAADKAFSSKYSK